MVTREEKLEEDEHRARTDRGVGHVERGKIPCSAMEMNEVDDVLEPDAVVKISHRAAEDQSRGQPRHTRWLGQSPCPYEEHGDHQNAEAGHDERIVGPEGERTTGVMLEIEIQQAGDDLHATEGSLHQSVRCVIFRSAVQHKDRDHWDPEPHGLRFFVLP